MNKNTLAYIKLYAKSGYARRYIAVVSKMINISFLCFIIQSQAFANGAQDIIDLIQDNMSKGNHLGVLAQLQENRSTYSNSSSRMFFFDYLACYESFLGLNKKALKHIDAWNNTQSEQTFIDIDKIKLTNAKQVIVDAGKTHQVIFINEEHHVSQHRAFTLSLLQDLYHQGYRYFAAEALEPDDSTLNARGYPVSQKSGFLINEPMYGELIRAARKMGYTIIAYDMNPECDAYGDSPWTCINKREEGQAKNLYDQILKNDPTAKLLVHAGRGHIAKKESDGWIPMAVYFENITGIRPYSVDQTYMREHGTRLYEDTIYRAIADTGLLNAPSVIVDENNANWLPSALDGVYDLIVFHPRTVYKNNRPGWLFDTEQRKTFDVSNERCKGEFPCVVEALIEQEGLESVPLDRLFIPSSRKRSSRLALIPGGRYIIRASNKQGATLSLEHIVMENVIQDNSGHKS